MVYHNESSVESIGSVVSPRVYFYLNLAWQPHAFVFYHMSRVHRLVILLTVAFWMWTSLLVFNDTIYILVEIKSRFSSDVDHTMAMLDCSQAEQDYMGKNIHL